MRNNGLHACVKCGHVNSDDAQKCADCEWPLVLTAWKSSRFTIRRITVDTCCINARQHDEAMNRLERWDAQGKLVLERTPAMTRELKGSGRIEKSARLASQQPVWVLGASTLGRDTFPAGPDRGEALVRELFPDARKMISNDYEDAEHLRMHVIHGADAFVTNDKRAFLLGGRQEYQRRMGVWIFQPPELVQLLEALHAWSG